MVYCGKPSRGCQMCRTRRIKCDEGRPTCQQCAKSRRSCPGYRDDFDIVFRNETTATERRARRKAEPRRNGHVDEERRAWTVVTTTTTTAATQQRARAQMPSPPWSQSSSSSATPWSGSGSPVTHLDVPLELQAPCFFISNYVLSPRIEGGKGYFDFLVPLIQREPVDSALATAFRAVSMAALANRPSARNSHLGLKALDQYTRALKATNLALQDSTKQLEDSTLAAIIVLSFYESIASDSSRVLAWGAHIEGSVQLINKRGRGQLRTAIGRSLFRTIRASLIIHCMSSSKRISEPVEWWTADALAVGDREYAEGARLNLQIVQLRADINEVIATAKHDEAGTERVRHVLHRTQALHADFRAWEQSLPEDWQPRTIAWMETLPGIDLYDADICPGRVDTYEDPFVSSSRNLARVSRLFLAGIEVRCAAWLHHKADYRTTAEYASAARQGSDMVTDILAAVPYHLGLHEHFKDAGGSRAPYETTPLSIRDVGPKALGGFFSMWPLYVAQCSDFATDAQRQWIAGRLKYIHEVHGMNQAGVLGRYQLRLPSMIIERDIKTAEMSSGSAPMTSGGGLPTRKTSPPSQPVTTYANILPSPSPEAKAAANSAGHMTGQMQTSMTLGSKANGHAERVVIGPAMPSHVPSVVENHRSGSAEQHAQAVVATQDHQAATTSRALVAESSKAGYDRGGTAAISAAAAGNGNGSGISGGGGGAGGAKVRLPSVAPYPWLKGLGWVEDT